MDLVEATYGLTAKFPADERFGLVSQMRRASISITSNLAEGHAVRAVRWTLRHLMIAIGSSAELESQLEAALRLRFVDEIAASPFRQLIDREQKLLYGMRRERLGRIATKTVRTIILVIAL